MAPPPTSRIARTRRAFEAIGAWDPDRGLDYRTRRSGTCSGAAGQRRHVASAAGATRPRPGLQRRRRYAGQSAARGSDLWLLAAPVRWRRERRRPVTRDRWQAALK